MSRQRTGWIERRGQVDAAAAIDQVIDRPVQPGEQVRQMPDELIENSPYQARQAFVASDVESLAQGMRAEGFQGVLIVRPHGEGVKQGRGVVQLVYGHRRRAAWRQVCSERGEPCVLPVVVREVSDERMLTIGAQENLQRQDLDPVEEGQIVAWLERVYFEKNQAELGAMVGKSSDWVSVRSRIHKLPEPLKARLRQRPRAIGQMLELGALYAQQPEAACLLADRVVDEQLTLDAVRGLVRGYNRPDRGEHASSPDDGQRRGAATSVQDVTNDRNSDDEAVVVRRDGEPNRQGAALVSTSRDKKQGTSFATTPSNLSPMEQSAQSARSDDDGASTTADSELLREAVATLSAIAARAEFLPPGVVTDHLLDQAERALVLLRSISKRQQM